MAQQIRNRARDRDAMGAAVIHYLRGWFEAYRFQAFMREMQSRGVPARNALRLYGELWPHQ